MKASVVIPTKNPGVIFQNVLAAVLGQSTEFDFEVLVVDSGSTDGTLEFIRKTEDHRLHLHCIDPASFGHGRTRNLGVSLTSGEYIAVLTHDATPINNEWLSNLVRVAESDSSIAGVFGRHVAYEDADVYTKQELVAHFEGLRSFPLIWMNDPEKYKSDQGYRQLLHFFSDNNALLRRSVWERINYPDVDFAEDQQWAKLIIEAGYKKAYAHEAIVSHSHQYSLTERMKRSFDESYAFKRYFGYVLCPNFFTFLRSWLGLSFMDIKRAISNGYWRSDFLYVARRPADNFMKVLGHYLGGIGTGLPACLRSRLSWDARLTK